MNQPFVSSTLAAPILPEPRGGKLVDERVTEAMAAFCAGVTASALPPPVINAAKRMLLDFTGVAVRGSLETSSRIVAETTERLSPHRPDGSVVIGHATRNGAEYAALMNGASVHGLELDDIHPIAAIHPGAAVFPAALAVGEKVDASGRDLLAAVVVGYEVSCRLSRSLVPAEHGGHGFHSTATCGVFGAAAAAAHLMRLSADQFVNAFGICGSQAAGSVEFLTDGAWTKRLHPGWAAHAGIFAAELARSGFTGPRRIFEGKAGFLRWYSDRPQVETLLDDLGSDYLILGVANKPHAACRYSQAAIDATLMLAREHDLQPDKIKLVTVHIFQGAIPIVAEPLTVKRRPRSVVDAQFSVHFAVATALMRGRVMLSDYRPDCLTAPEVHALMDRIECVHEPTMDMLFPRLWPASVVMTLYDGRRFEARMDVLHGDPADPLSWDELVVKAEGLMKEVFQHERVAAITGAIREVEGSSVRAFAQLLSV